MGKRSDTKAVTAPVPAPNLAAIEEFLRKDPAEDEDVPYNNHLYIPLADDIPDCDDRGNTARTINRQDNGQNINYKCNCPMMLSSEDDYYKDGGSEVESPIAVLDDEEEEDQFNHA
jgi:hypothetical protein